MAPLLSDEWFAVVADEAAALAPVPGATLVVQNVVTGSPDGKVQVAAEFADGALVDVRTGKRPDATCTLTWAYADALAVLRGEVDVDVAFMRGDLKVDGDYTAVLYGLRPVFAGEAGREFVAAVAARTDG